MSHEFAQLVDLNQIKALMQAFYDVTGIPSTLTDVTGNLLRTSDGAIVGAGWKRICLDYHRTHPETAEYCVKSDTVLAHSVGCGQAGLYECLNGLVDVAIPVVIDGDHLVNLFTGQFLLAPPDREAFRQRAQRFGFDEDNYLRALDEVPVFSEDFVNKGLRFLEMLAANIADLGLKQKRLLEELERSQRAQAEAQRAQQAIEMASRASSRFFASASHDLRQPLQALRLFIDVLSAKLAGTENESLIQRACQGLASAESLLTSLFDVARIEAGTTAPSLSEVSLASCFTGLAKEVAPQAIAKGLYFACLPTDLTVHTDRAMLERILRNLLTNALRYTDRGGVIMRCRRRAGCAVIEVWDSGQGIAAEHLPDIWEAFFQIGNPQRDRSEGLGLGLSIAKKLANTLGFHMDVTSRVGRGTLFRVFVPDTAIRQDTDGTTINVYCAGA
ncbi:MAG: PocR ligand-binding domain-containing protein [Rhodospirillaceae bacterium]|nr:PocR ligand-binding domain-containing protein [Rhodospirillales bacterium]